MEIKLSEKEKVFFTSDTHFNHHNIIKYCNRPFTRTALMNEELIKKWNSVVGKDDVIFHLGDFSMGTVTSVLDILPRLNGKKYLIVGNHEKDIMSNLAAMDHFEGIYDMLEIFVSDKEISYGKQHIVLCHYPMLEWNASHRGSWQLFGHVHGGLSNKGIIQHKPTQMDVGVDTNPKYTPYSYQEVKEIITKQCLAKR